MTDEKPVAIRIPQPEETVEPDPGAERFRVGALWLAAFAAALGSLLPVLDLPTATVRALLMGACLVLVVVAGVQHSLFTGRRGGALRLQALMVGVWGAGTVITRVLDHPDNLRPALVLGVGVFILGFIIVSSLTGQDLRRASVS